VVALATWVVLRFLGYGGGTPWWLVVGGLTAVALLDCGQGYHYARPLHPQDIDRILDEAGEHRAVLP
jgi:hypothetical protein